MSGFPTEFLTALDWMLVALAALCLSAAVLAGTLYYRARKENARLLTALNNMSEGLCMFDASARLILCNERYLEMYGLRPEIAKPGCSLRELLDERKRANTFAGDPEQYIAEALRRMRSGQSVQDVREMPDGRFISIA